MLVKGRRQARLSEASFKNAGAREWKALGHLTMGTLPVPGDGGLVSGKASGKLWIEQPKIAFTSSGSSVCGRSNRPIRKKVIGHSRSYLRNTLTGQSVFLHLLRAFPLLHQPAREHRRGIFLHPLVEKAANLFAEVGGMSKTREFKALQRIARGGEKELPRGFGFAIRHVDLLEESILKVTVQ